MQSLDFRCVLSFSVVSVTDLGARLQEEAAEGHIVGLNLNTGEPLDPVSYVPFVSRLS